MSSPFEHYLLDNDPNAPEDASEFTPMSLEDRVGLIEQLIARFDETRQECAALVQEYTRADTLFKQNSALVYAQKMQGIAHTFYKTADTYRDIAKNIKFQAEKIEEQDQSNPERTAKILLLSSQIARMEAGLDQIEAGISENDQKILEYLAKQRV